MFGKLGKHFLIHASMCVIRKFVFISLGHMTRKSTSSSPSVSPKWQIHIVQLYFALGVYEDTRFVTSLGRHHLSFMTESELRTAHASEMSWNGYAGGLWHLDTLEYMTAKVLCMIAKSIVLSRLR